VIAERRRARASIVIVTSALSLAFVVALFLAWDGEDGDVTNRGSVPRETITGNPADVNGSSDTAKRDAVGTGIPTDTASDESEDASPDGAADDTPPGPISSGWVTLRELLVERERRARASARVAAPGDRETPSVSVPPWTEAGIEGHVVDAATGTPLRALDVRFTTFRAFSTPEGDIARIAAQAPISSFITRTDDSGAFAAASPDPEDASLRVHVEVVTPGFHPIALVLDGRDGSDGTWSRAVVPESELASTRSYRTLRKGRRIQTLEIALRRALTAPIVLATADGRRASHVPVLVTPWREGFDFLDASAIEIGANGRILEPVEPMVIHTDAAGRIHLASGDAPYDLALLDPLRFLAESFTVGTSGVEALRALLTTEEPLVLAAIEGVRAEHRLVDRGGRPIGGIEIEIALDGMQPRRVATDDAGFFAIGVLPRPPGEDPVSIFAPRRGTLTLLASDFDRDRIDIDLPRSQVDIVIAADRSPRVALRLVRNVGDERIGVAPIAFSSDLDAIPLWFGRDGIIELATGPLEGEDEFRVEVEGFEPRIARADAGTRAEDAIVVDWGEYRLEPGLAQEIRLALRGAADGETGTSSGGAELAAKVLEGAVLELRPEDGDFAGQRLLVPEDGRVVARGLSPGVWELAVEGPWILPSSARHVVGADRSAEPVVFDVERTPVEYLTISGHVPSLTLEDAARCVVVERFHRRGSSEPVTFPPYALAPDGTFGSVRRIEGIERVSVHIIGSDDRAAEGSLARPTVAADPFFAFGELRLRRRSRADVRFEVEGIGAVLPPVEVALSGNSGIESIARLRVGGHILHVDDLRRGEYTLRWRSDGEVETLGFAVEHDDGAPKELIAHRAARNFEIVRIPVVDSRDQPISGARVSPPIAKGSGGYEPGDSILVAVEVGKPTEFTVSRDGYLPARVAVPAGAVVPSTIPLYRAARARGRVLDADGGEAEGHLAIRWDPIVPTFIEPGEPLEVPLVRGRFSTDLLPPTTLRFSFRLAGSDVAVERTLSLIENGEEQDLGVLRLEPTRVLTGRVEHWDGSPARDVDIIVVPLARSHRYPFETRFDAREITHRVRSDALGFFRLEGLPIEIPRDLALAARVEGTPVAVEWPIDADARDRRLVLDAPTRLEIDVGYREPGDFESHAFSLEFRPSIDGGGAQREDPIVLGEIPPELRGFTTWNGVRPGTYRVRWGLRESYEPLPWLWHDVTVRPGATARLEFLLDGRVVQGSARLNGAAVSRGWVLLTHDPGENGGTRVGRIRNGKFTIIDPPEVARAFAAVIPEVDPLPVQDFRRGEAVPVEIRGYAAQLRDGGLDVDYRGHEVTLRLAPNFLARHAGATLHYTGGVWNETRFEERVFSEPLVAPLVRFQLLAPTTHRFTIRSVRDSLIYGTSISLSEGDQSIDIR
jgi:hypothetical protein